VPGIQRSGMPVHRRFVKYEPSNESEPFRNSKRPQISRAYLRTTVLGCFRCRAGGADQRTASSCQHLHKRINAVFGGRDS
jgi:hypothetical protein